MFFDDRVTLVEGKPLWAKVIDRVQHNGFEQTIMTLFTVVVIILNLKDFGYDLRLPIAWGFAYLVGRVVFIAG